MNQTDDCGQIPGLLGVYALDAVDPTEAELVSQHLKVCARCAQEVAEHRETMGMFAAQGGQAPEGVWAAIAAAIEGDTGPEAVPAPPILHGGRDRRRTGHRRRVVSRGFAAAAAVAAGVLIGVQTVRVSHLDHQVSQLSAAARQAGGFQGVAAAMVNPSARHLVLTSTASDAKVVGQVVVLPSGSAYFVGGGLAALPASSTYQLWSVVSDRAVSVALLGDKPGAVAFSIDPGVAPKAFLVTVEPAGGVIVPTAAPVAHALF